MLEIAILTKGVKLLEHAIKIVERVLKNSRIGKY